MPTYLLIFFLADIYYLKNDLTFFDLLGKTFFHRSFCVAFDSHTGCATLLSMKIQYFYMVFYCHFFLSLCFSSVLCVHVARDKGETYSN